MGVERCAVGLGGGCHVRRRETTGIGEDCGEGVEGGSCLQRFRKR